MRVLFFIKISAMIFALVGVFYVMRYLRSKDFVQQTKSSDSALAILLGTSELKPYNWCPPDVQKVKIIADSREFTNTREIIGLCQVMMEPVLKEDAAVEDYQSLAIATGKQGEKRLERNSRNVFRVEGLPFRSKLFEKTFAPTPAAH